MPNVLTTLPLLVGGPVEKMSFFQMAPGSILSTQIHSDRCQYELCEVWFNKIEHIHTYGAVKVNIFFAMGFSGFGSGFCVGINVVRNGNHTSRSICAHKSCLLKCLHAYIINCLQIQPLLSITRDVKAM